MNRLTQIKYLGRVLEPDEIKKYKEQITLADCNKLFAEIFATPEISVSVYGDVTKQELMSEKELNSTYKSK